jgi:rare lipoprotein A
MKQDSAPQGTLRRIIPCIRNVVVLGGLVALVSGCSSIGGRGHSVGGRTDVSDIPDAVPKVEPLSRFGNPDSYVVFGKRYRTMDSSAGYVERGVASWYGPTFHGRRTSSGERYDMYAMTAAHKTLPLPTYARVTNLKNGRSAVVRINDRGPFHAGRVIDLSYAAASKLGVVDKGTARVEVRAIDPARPQPEENLFVSAGEEQTTKRTDARAGPLTPAVAAVRTPGQPVQSNAKTTGARVSVAKADDEAPKIGPASTTMAASKTESRVATAIRRPEPEVARTPETIVSKVATAAQHTEPQPHAASSGSKSQPKVAAVSAKTASPSTNAALYLQVGAFGERANAEHLRRRLVEHLAEHVMVRTSDGGKAPLYKVHIGPLVSRKKAANVSHRLAALGLTQSHVVVE